MRLDFQKPLFAFLFSLLFSSCMLLQPSIKRHHKNALKAHKQFDVAIVPGVPFNEPNWDMTMMMRVLWGVHLYQKGYVKNLIMSGGSVYTPFVEAEIMKQYAMNLGVPEERIIVESKAEHSTENIWYGTKLAKNLGFTSIALATDPFQNRLLYRFTKRRTKGVFFLPVIFDTLRTIPHTTPKINYEKLKLIDFKPITETQSFWHRWRGTRGKNINFKE